MATSVLVTIVASQKIVYLSRVSDLILIDRLCQTTIIIATSAQGSFSQSGNVQILRDPLRGRGESQKKITRDHGGGHQKITEDHDHKEGADEKFEIFSF